MKFDGLFAENERTSPNTEDRKFVEVGDLNCASGDILKNVQVCYETWGDLNASADNAILVCHALSGDSHCIGWWDRLVGPGKPIDTDHYFVICSNALGGCQGTTGPSSIAPDGKPYGSRFPFISVQNMVEVQGRLIDRLGIKRLLCVAGGSMGGMQAIEWSVSRPDKVQKVFATASAPAHSPMQIGFNETARQAILRDPKFKRGDYGDDVPADGLAIARMIGHLTFLSDVSFEMKFSRRLQNKNHPDFTFGVEFEVESYLKHQGEKFTTRFDANSLLYLTRAIDYYELKSFAGAVAEMLFVSYSSDWIYPSHQSAQLQTMAKEAGLKSTHVELDLPFGHDCFLLDGELQGAALAKFLSE